MMGVESNRRRQNARLNSTQRRKVRARVIARDNGICWLCGDPVDLTLEAPHPDSATMDHVIPHTLGGKHRASNLRLAHSRCNADRGCEA